MKYTHDSRQNDSGASVRLHGHDRLVQKYDAITLVRTEMNCEMWVNNNINNRQTSNIVLPLNAQTHTHHYHHHHHYKLISMV